VETMLAALGVMSMAVSMLALYESRRAQKVARAARHSLKKVEPAVLQEQHRKMVSQHNLFAQDLSALKVEVGNIMRQANALGLKKLAAGVIPSPKESADQ